MRRKTIGGIIMGFIVLFLLGTAIDMMVTPIEIAISWGPNTIMSVLGTLIFNYLEEWD